MAYKVVILQEAKADIKEAKAYYRSILKILNKRFTEDIKNTVTKIKNNPAAFGFRYDHFRTANLPVFPYQIHFFIDDRNSIVIIFAVLHAFRDPDFIKSGM